MTEMDGYCSSMMFVPVSHVYYTACLLDDLQVNVIVQVVVDKCIGEAGKGIMLLRLFGHSYCCWCDGKHLHLKPTGLLRISTKMLIFSVTVGSEPQLGTHWVQWEEFLLDSYCES